MKRLIFKSNPWNLLGFAILFIVSFYVISVYGFMAAKYMRKSLTVDEMIELVTILSFIFLFLITFEYIAVSRLTIKQLLVLICIILLVYLVAGRPLLFYLYKNERLRYYSILIKFISKTFDLDWRCYSYLYPLDEYYQRTEIFLFHIVVIAFLIRGFIYIFRNKDRIILLFVNLCLLFCIFVLAEFYFNLESVQRIFGSVQYEVLNEKINKGKRLNKWRFTDKERSPQKESSDIFRIVVMGDSFIWGDGLYLDDIWSHVLEKKLHQKYGKRIEVIHWGRCGWSTQKQLHFLKKKGRKFEIDLLIIGFVENDPEVYGVAVAPRYFVWGRLIKACFPIFKNTVRFITKAINDFLYTLPYFRAWGYRGWKRFLYTGENWKAYKVVIKEFKNHLENKKINYFFVNTPVILESKEHRKEYEHEHRLLYELFGENNIPYYDLLPQVLERYGSYSARQIRRELWANPVNGHPGRKLSQLYADLVLKYLEDNKMLPFFYKKSPPVDSKPSE